MHLDRDAPVADRDRFRDLGKVLARDRPISLCEGDEYIVIIGDFNTTINSMGGSTLGSCTDVASMHGAGAGATWPTILPPIMGVAIDRFLVGRAYSPAEATMHIQRSVTGSDHWAITGSIPALSD
ncbi:endonuclease/exonuclease/phosphatase family protein [Microbacterium sp. BLY]|uniref:endonuclease/exonuclease/phosphatase family protein n=1 Tax=Microbacterium sp. BLY TaxID=2823280 RepID=UPI001B3222C6|nr:endonuclease/exonuclease/phosphatase family protein [Microbacterium sp. BLY]MBP3977012.1 endonuclease/exonuclease/phosphatase family protein [Microbacterium sp. BLY]